MDHPQPLSAADIVVLLAGCHGTNAVRTGVRAVADGVGLLGGGLKVTVLCTSDAAATEDAQPAVVAMPFPPLDRFPVIAGAPHDGYRILFNAARRAGARACVALGADESNLTPELVRTLVQPILSDECDVVAPVYQRRVFDGLLNAAVVYPLTRALYGRKVMGQLGLDYAFSSHVTNRWGTGANDVPVARPTWIVPQAIVDDLRIGQAQLDVRLPAPPESTDLATLLTQILGSLFTDIEQRAAFWQRVQRAQTVPQFGTPARSQAAVEPVDVRPLVESYALAYRNMQSVWPLILPPATLVDLKRLAATEPARFRIPDDLWARIVFDFALAHRLRTITRDHLLKALAPLYLAWIASYAAEAADATPQAADGRLEDLCRAFEAEKPYLVRRWRWPDRFNP